jgi:hypothetical protein
MKRLLLAATAVAAIALSGMVSAKADVVLDTQLSGTGDNVIFQSLLGNVATGSFNGQHTGFVTFTDLSNNPLFIGAANGNDIKIANTNDLKITVFDSSFNLFGTTTDVFSLKGTGSVTAFVSAVDQFGNPEAIQTFSLGTIDPNAQSGFTLRAINGEVITSFTLLDIGGNIADFEHYRVDVTLLPSAVPGPIAGAGIPGLIAALGGMFGLNRWRRKRRVA